MTNSRAVTAVTYNGVDGACAAAAVLRRHPDADVVVTSAARVGRTLSALADEAPEGALVHVCGVGVHCAWPGVAEPARALAQRRARLVWHCGRGYMERLRERLSEICEPHFASCGSNTAALCRYLKLGGDPVAPRLFELARYDPNIQQQWPEPPGDVALWIDLIHAAIAQYFKYQDEEPYRGAIRKLARFQHDEDDLREVAVFRRSGFRHVLWGRSRAMRGLRDRIRRCAEVDEPVLITGESGVGKECVAHLLHERSRRSMGPLVAVNCALFAGNPGLANSMLFGHVRGAFTGAERDRDGAFVSAHAGILFLDEMGELPPEVQGKFLRVVEDACVTPEGSDTPRRIDVRLIAATNRDLPALVRAGAFRADLYHRLDVLRIHVPPLRERLEDIDAIVEHVLPGLLPTGGPRRLAGADVDTLRSYDWPGNVRQLIKVLKRTVCLGAPLREIVEEERRLGPLSPETDRSADGGVWPSGKDDVRPIREIRRLYALRALALHGGNHAATARALSIAPNTLRAYLRPDE